MRENKIKLLDFLLSHADVNQTNALNESPLLVACMCGTSEVVQKLLQKGADIEASTCHRAPGEDYVFDQSALWQAVFNQHEDIVKTLVAAYPRRPYFPRLLHEAAELAKSRGNRELEKWLEGERKTVQKDTKQGHRWFVLCA